MYYFAYGMNTNKVEMAARCPRAKFLGTATLLNHKFRFAGHADIVNHQTEHVDGALWLITPQCLYNLDILEGYPGYYNRKKVSVHAGTEKISAWIYYMHEGVAPAPPSVNYWNCLTEGYADHGISSSQLYRAIDEVQYQNLTNNVNFDILRS